MNITQEKLKSIFEAAILATGQPISLDQLLKLFTEDEKPSREDARNTIKLLQEDYSGRGMELIEVGSGYRIQAKQDYAQWVSRLWEEKPARYSRALLETLVLIAYKQPITRGEIENVRGVSVSSNIIKTLQEREWVRVVGHRDVPGKPAIYATTRQFLDYFNLKSLDQLPTLSEIRDLDKISEELAVQETQQDINKPAVDDNTELSQTSEPPVGDTKEEYSDEAASEESFDQQQIAQELEGLAESIQTVDHEAEIFIDESEHTIDEIESETDLSRIQLENIATVDNSEEHTEYSAIKDSRQGERLVVEIIQIDNISENLDQDVADYEDSVNSYERETTR